ncbi:MAG TPA: PH domain-containing protein, partial [Ilumatobacteraceae bacterium]|nr:PH domain-containing protein [Ilumatobacteraceae bacterium]
AASIIAGIAVLVALDDGGLKTFLKWVTLIAIVLTAIWTVFRYLKWITTNFVITSDRLIFRHGVVGKMGIEIPLERVNNVNFHQT